jgi:hypothetical protein
MQLLRADTTSLPLKAMMAVKVFLHFIFKIGHKFGRSIVEIE